MGRILAIDYGRKRVGIAVTDPLQLSSRILPFQLETKIKDWLLQYIKDEDVEKIVIGYPEHADGASTNLTKDIDRLIEVILNAFADLEIIKLEESFSSKDAVQLMIKQGVRKQKRTEKGLIDSYSALVILQDYLERNKI